MYRAERRTVVTYLMLNARFTLEERTRHMVGNLHMRYSIIADAFQSGAYTHYIYS